MSEHQRRVVAWVTVSMDGYTSGPAGPAHDTWLYAHSMREQSAAHYESVWRGASTLLLGRTNYEGFFSLRSATTLDASVDPRTHALGAYLDSVEKVVFSRTLERTEWENSRVSRDPETEVRALRDTPGRDILVSNSASVIQTLLRADLVDDLRFVMVPTLLGGGLRLFETGLPHSTWSLAQTTVLADGAVGLHYRRHP